MKTEIVEPCFFLHGSPHSPHGKRSAMERGLIRAFEAYGLG
jgi:hypothetical protein